MKYMITWHDAGKCGIHSIVVESSSLHGALKIAELSMYLNPDREEVIKDSVRVEIIQMGEEK